LTYHIKGLNISYTTVFFYHIVSVIVITCLIHKFRKMVFSCQKPVLSKNISVKKHKQNRSLIICYMIQGNAYLDVLNPSPIVMR